MREDRAGSTPLHRVEILAARSGDVSQLADHVRRLIAPSEPTDIAVNTSGELAAIRAQIEGDLGSFSQQLTLIGLLIGGLVVASTSAASIMVRRRDFGRRRALGATNRGQISFGW